MIFNNSKMIDKLEIGNHPLVSSLLASLDGEVKDHISTTIDALEKALVTIERWKGGEIDNINGKETNREHVLGMLDLVLENFELFSKICDIEELIIAILIHDMGEYRIGDIPQSKIGADKIKKRTKKHERKIAFKLISKINDEEIRQKLENIMNRCLNISVNGNIVDNDITILLLKILDIIQAYNYGLKNVFPDNLIFPLMRNDVIEHISSRLTIISGLFSLFEITIRQIRPEYTEEVKNFLNKTLTGFVGKIEEISGEKMEITPERYLEGMKYLLERYKNND